MTLIVLTSGLKEQSDLLNQNFDEFFKLVGMFFEKNQLSYDDGVALILKFADSYKHSLYESEVEFHYNLFVNALNCSKLKQLFSNCETKNLEKKLHNYYEDDVKEIMKMYYEICKKVI